ncbi:MAG: hypothetical protein HeimAB125_19620 [Candidatus Heimdallarchaeota archaeon AB_125]|nr:MAG: hypothetical protein HeimAB125_19620 [Candidatus Heimdallarchaeota archaeon AB_125]
MKPGEIVEYEDSFLSFGIDVKDTQIAYFNISAGSIMVWSVDYRDKNLAYGSYYTLGTNGLGAAKVLLQPGYYYFFNPVESLYDFDIEYNAVLAEEFTGSSDFLISQRDGDPSNYKLFEITNADFAYHNYNVSFLTQLNRTVDFEYTLFLENNPVADWTSGTDTIGNQQVDGIYEGYPTNDVQSLNLLSTG